MTVIEIIRACGGAKEVAKAVGLGKDAIYKWQSSGIPDRHWPTLVEMSGSTLDAITIFEANQTARNQSEEAAA